MKKIKIDKFNPSTDLQRYYDKYATFEKMWRRCHRGDYLLWIAKKIGVDDRTLVRAMAMCANTVRHLMLDKRSTAAIDAAFKYAAGEINRDALQRHWSTTNEVADQEYENYLDDEGTNREDLHFELHAALLAHAVVDYPDDYIIEDWEVRLAVFYNAIAGGDYKVDCVARHAANAAYAAAYVAACAAQDAACAAENKKTYGLILNSGSIHATCMLVKMANLSLTAQICREILTDEVFRIINKTNAALEAA